MLNCEFNSLMTTFAEYDLASALKNRVLLRWDEFLIQETALCCMVAEFLLQGAEFFCDEMSSFSKEQRSSAWWMSCCYKEESSSALRWVPVQRSSVLLPSSSVIAPNSRVLLRWDEFLFQGAAFFWHGWVPAPKSRVLLRWDEFLFQGAAFFCLVVE